jgi:hypothetical protein
MTPSPDLLTAIQKAQAEAAAYRAKNPPKRLSQEQHDRAVDELMKWLQSDSLDWEAVERAHRSRA